MNRRRFLTRSGALLGAAALAPAGTLRRDPAPRALVLLQLSGGNDGLSTVVPWSHAVYRDARKKTRLEEADLIDLGRGKGLNGALRNLAGRWERGQLAIVEGVGYPEMRRSHFASMDVWHAGDPRGRLAEAGWVGRLAESAWAADDSAERVVHLGREAPYSLFSGVRPPIALASPTAYRWLGGAPDAEYSIAPESAPGEARHIGRDAALARLRRRLGDAQDSSRAIRAAALSYTPRARYPRTELGARLHDVAALVHGETGTRVFSLELRGFDTHADQRGAHDRLLGTLDDALGAFLDDLDQSEVGRQTAVLAFSEFGRRVRENASGGTDHGKAGPVFLVGSRVRGGFHGRAPTLVDLDQGDLAPTTDLREIYAAVIRGVFDADPEVVLGAKFEGLELFG